MRNTAKRHTVIFAGAAVVFTALGILAARSARGYWAVGGEYFLPLLAALAWAADMKWLGWLSRRSKYGLGH